MAAASEPRRALVTGLTGQDGSFLAELLLERGYQVTGMIRACPSDGLGLAEHLRGQIDLVNGDLLDAESLREAVAQTLPDELYHLAAPSFVPESWTRPERTLAAIAGSTAALLEAVREHNRQTRVFVAGSGAMFGATPETPQHEDTACWPETPYATAKLAAHQLVGQIRRNAGLFACSGILYNHESERRPEWFVTRKITRSVAAINLGLVDELKLGDVTAVRDWSFAADVMTGAWLMLQQADPADYILASGEGHTVMEFAEAAFAHVGMDAREYVRIDDSLRRAPEQTPRVGDPSRARERLGWQPGLSFNGLVGRMVEADLRSLR